MKISTEVSEPTPARGLRVGSFEVPPFNTRRVATGIELRDGESFAIAGLLRDDVTEVISEFPGFGDIPILGALFRSTEFERKKTELLIIATPHLIVPHSGGRPALPTDHFSVPSAVEFFFMGSMEGSPGEGREGSAGSLSDEASHTGAKPAEVEHALELSSVPMQTEDRGLAFRVFDSFAGAIGHALDLSGAEGELR